MRIFITLFCLILHFFCCFSMHHSYYVTSNAQTFSNTNAASIQHQPVVQNLSAIQKIALEAVGASVRISNGLLAHLPTDLEIPMIKSKLKYNAFMTSLTTLTEFLEIAYFNNLAFKIEWMTYNEPLQNNNISYFYPISVAIDFLHVPLLVACKKHFADDNNFLNAGCMEEGKYICAIDKYEAKLKKLDKLCTSNINNTNVEITSYFLSERNKLPTIMRILTKPKCYE